MNLEMLDEPDIEKVKSAIIGDGYFFGYIPDKGFDFFLENFRELKNIGVLENNWMDAYSHSNNFSHVPLQTLKEIFDTCDSAILQEQYPIYVGDHFSSGKRFSLFRGCAGDDHRIGMSWTSSLDKAIWYAAHHAECNDLGNLAVYTTVVERGDIYCCGNHYDYDFIVCPKEVWRVIVPEKEFRIDRPR